MAELLGVAASVVGIGAFAVQIIENVQKLRRGIVTLTHSQAHLESLLDELDLLATLISQLDYTRPADLDIVDNRWRVPFCCCSKAADNVLAVLRDVQTGFDRTRMKKASVKIKFVLKEKEIKAHMNKLERAKSMLIIAQQTLLQ